VQAGLAACAQVDGPITSIYRWEGKVAREAEHRLLLKFTPDAQADLERTLLAQHPYDTPQWVVLPASHVSEKYLSWAQANSSSLSL
jgi:periplasmic divalent cation tolerance protein